MGAGTSPRTAGEPPAAVTGVTAAGPRAFPSSGTPEEPRALDSRNGGRGPAGEPTAVRPDDGTRPRRPAAEPHHAPAGLPGGRAHHRPGASRPAAPPRRSGGDPLAGRYAITSALRHGTGGGVFLARDTRTGEEVVVKQARAPFAAQGVGADARAALRREAALLERLAGLGLAPRPVGLVEREDSLFLVQERITGQPLDRWVAARLRTGGGPGLDWAEAGPLARALVDLLERVHAEGLALYGLSPAAVLVRPDGSPCLVGLGLAAGAGCPAGPAGTPGYRAPEQAPSGRLALVTDGVPAAPGPAAGRAADLYALGGLFFLLATGHDPLLPEELPAAPPVADRLGRWLALAAREGATARRLAPPVLGLRADEPRRRWSLTRVREALTTEPAGAGHRTKPGARTAVVKAGAGSGPAGDGGSPGTPGHHRPPEPELSTV
ncbi:protein kinase domain-containing protein [Kitasatospora sp. NPDC004240]